MTQDEINLNEWNNPENWSALTYGSRIDSRLFVPKRSGIGATINFGHRFGTLVLVGLLAVALVPIAIVLALVKK
jgi:uncharacterized membrane protein